VAALAPIRPALPFSRPWPRAEGRAGRGAGRPFGCSQRAAAPGL